MPPGRRRRPELQRPQRVVKQIVDVASRHLGPSSSSGATGTSIGTPVQPQTRYTPLASQSSTTHTIHDDEDYTEAESETDNDQVTMAEQLIDFFTDQLKNVPGSKKI